MVLYVLVFVMAAGSWLGWTRALWKGALWTLALAILIHTAGLAGRIYISGRPPVTNLASSAIFIAWGAALLALFQELIFRNGIGAVTASVLGFTSLLIAHRLSLQGDTLKVLVAVLDTNFWLATHVISITLGYASTFLAGMLAIIYVIRGLFTRSLDEAQASNLTRMIYGIVCFATLFSFVGTILGGIWADQSWGRFWGWDPKENGAVLIVLWNALILHARWAGLVRQRGVALLAIGGNIVTSWSWFGTNMLGVGLHSYGFMDSALRWLLLFVSSQLILIGLGLIPLSKWRSFGQDRQPPVAPRAKALAGVN
jgi:ABC-type transport system involved in cytochrome c biogenesis permease subunit